MAGRSREHVRRDQSEKDPGPVRQKKPLDFLVCSQEELPPDEDGGQSRT